LGGCDNRHEAHEKLLFAASRGKERRKTVSLWRRRSGVSRIDMAMKKFA
jgi:hypothetical protein